MERQQVLSTRSGCRWVLRRMKPAIRHYGTPLSMCQIRRAAQDRVIQCYAVGCFCRASQVWLLAESSLRFNKRNRKGTSHFGTLSEERLHLP